MNKTAYGDSKNESGEVIIPPTYDQVDEDGVDYGFAVVQPEHTTHWGLIDETGAVIIPFEYDYIFVSPRGWIHTKKNEERFLFNTRGELILKITGIIFWYYPEEGVIRVKKESGWGAIDMKGNTLIDFTYRSLGPCINGWLSYYDNGAWGWLTSNGEIAVPASFDEVGAYDQTSWWGKKGKVCHIYDYQNQELRLEPWDNIKTRFHFKS